MDFDHKFLLRFNSPEECDQIFFLMYKISLIIYFKRTRFF